MATPTDTDRAKARALLVSYAASKGLSTDPLPEWCQATARLVANTCPTSPARRRKTDGGEP